MPEDTEAVATQSTQQDAPEIKGHFGKATRVPVNFDKTAMNDVFGEELKPIVEAPANEPVVEKDTATPKPESKSVTETSATSTKEKTQKQTESTDKSPSLSDDDIRNYFKEKGIEYDGVDSLRKKLKPTEESLEQERREKSEFEQKMVDAFVNGGGTVEQYVALKKLAEQPLPELSSELIKKELLEAGVNEDVLSDILSEQFFQVTDEQLEDMDEEGKAAAIKLREYGKKKLENYGSHIQNQSKKILEDLKKHINSVAEAGRSEAQLLSTIDDTFANMPKQLSVELGEINGETVPPLNYEISESDIQDVKSQLSDINQRQKLLYNEDGGLNIAFISQLLLEHKMRDSLVKTALLEGGTRQVNILEKRLPYTSPYDVGLSSPRIQNNQKGSFGKARKAPMFAN